MRYLIYVSQAKHPMSREELADILAGARRWNEAHGITGLLIYRHAPERNRGHFMQLIEGEAEALGATYERIVADPRHHTKIVLEEGDTGERAFPNWTMGFRDLDPGELADDPNFRDLGSETFEARARAGDIRGALSLMRSFYDAVD